MAVSFVGASTVTTTIAGQTHTPHASTVVGDLVLFFHYTTPDTGTESVTPPAGFTTIFNSITTSFGLLAVAYRFRQAGDTTYSSTIANHATGTSGDSMLEWLETWRDVDPTTPIGAFTASLSTWASSLNLGPIAAPASPSLPDGAAVVVFGGRMENVTSQTLLTGHSLTWAPSTIGTTNTGRDAGTASQHGINASGSAQTITAKTIVTAGTAQAGGGRMFFLLPAPPVGGPDLVEDDFNRADSGTISDATHPWVERLDTGGAISNNTLRQLTSGGTPLVAVWDQALASVDMWAEATVAGTYAGGFLGPILRYNPTTDNGFSVEMADGFLKNIRVVNGSPSTDPDIGPAWTPVVGQLWRAEIEGAGASTVIRLYIDNVLRKTWTTPKSGLSGTFCDTFPRPGLHLNSENNDTTQAWANFRAGTLPYTPPGGGEVAIEGAVEAIGDLAGDASRERTAEATIDAVAELAGDASRDRAAAANIDAVAELVGDITVTAPGGGEVTVEGAVEAVAEIVGAVVRDQAAAATVDAVAELAGAVIRDRAAAGAVEAIGELAGDISIAGQVTITGAVEAVAEIAAAPIVAKAAAGAVEAVADLAGEVVLSQLVAAAIEAVADLAGDATVTGPVTVTAEVDVVISPTRLRARASTGPTRGRAQASAAAATRLGADVAATRGRAKAGAQATTRSRAAATLNGGTRNRAQVDDVEATRLGLEAQVTRV